MRSMKRRIGASAVLCTSPRQKTVSFVDLQLGSHTLTQGGHAQAAFGDTDADDPSKDLPTMLLKSPTSVLWYSYFLPALADGVMQWKQYDCLQCFVKFGWISLLSEDMFVFSLS